MVKQNFSAVRIRLDLQYLAEAGNKGRQQSLSSYFTGLLADGLKYRFLRQNFRPPKPLLDQLLPHEIFVLYGQWLDAIDSAFGVVGPLGNHYEFALVSPVLSYAEPGKKDTFVPVPKGICGADRVKTEHGEFPVYVESMQSLWFDSLKPKELAHLKQWLSSEGR
jgi:hypothetical protein